MLRIYDIETAKKTILKRASLSTMTFPPKILERTEQLFGAGATPQQAVAKILASVQAEGDKALRRWCLLLDHVVPAEFHIPSEDLEKAYRSQAADLLVCHGDRCRAHPPFPRIPAASKLGN